MTSHSLFVMLFMLSMVLSGLYLALSEPGEFSSFLLAITAVMTPLSIILYLTRRRWMNARFGE